MANFFVKTVTGSMLYQPVSQWHSLHFELLIELVAKKLTELWRFKNLAYFLTWWPSSMTYLFVNVTYWNCSPIPYVDQVWWWYVKAFMSYAWQNWQTNRQTDRQTDKPTNEHNNHRYCKVILLVATREAMGLSSWQPLEKITRKAGKQDFLGCIWYLINVDPNVAYDLAYYISKGAIKVITRK